MAFVKQFIHEGEVSVQIPKGCMGEFNRRAAFVAEYLADFYPEVCCAEYDLAEQVVLFDMSMDIECPEQILSQAIDSALMYFREADDKLRADVLAHLAVTQEPQQA